MYVRWRSMRASEIDTDPRALLCCRSIAVHPTLPVMLTCSDDMLIKLWDWDKGWQCTQIFEGHSHYVMQVGVSSVSPTFRSSRAIIALLRAEQCAALH